MAKDFFGWTRWSPHLGNALTIGLGVPAVIAIVAGWWAHLAPSGDLAVALVVLATFMMTLWCCIGVLWIRDRNKSCAGRIEFDCAWGLRFDAAILNFNPSQELEWQLRLVVRNSKSFRIKGDIVEQRLVIEGRVPNVKMEVSRFPFILGSAESTQIAFPPYKKGTLPDQDVFKGEIDFASRYGHPDGPYTRIAIRKFAFEAMVKPPKVQGLFPVLPSSDRSIMLPIGPREQERDEAYRSD